MSLDADAVSVIVCVYTMKRWADICNAIRSIATQRTPVGEIIIVVDYNPELLTRLRCQFPDCRVIANKETKGLSGARNTGVGNTSGRLIAFLDDDAIAPPDWIDTTIRHFEDPQVLGVSSRVAPLWQGQRPRWFPDEFLWVVGCTHNGLKAGPVRNLLGASMLISCDLFDRVGGFNHRLGRTQHVLPMGAEETELCMRATEAIPNATFRYDDAVTVTHKVHAERLTWRYFIIRCFAEGISKAQLVADAGAGARLSTERSYVVGTISKGCLNGLARGCFSLEMSGFGQAFAIVAGLASATAGLLFGKLRTIAPKRIENGVGARTLSGSNPLRLLKD